MKTKFGISAALMAAIVYVLILVTSWNSVVAVAVVAWLLCTESDEFLRVSVVKAYLIAILFTVLSQLLGFVDRNLIDVIDGITRVFGADTTFAYTDFAVKVKEIFSFLRSLINWVQIVLMLLLAFFAAKKKTIALPIVDRAIAKHMLRD